MAFGYKVPTFNLWGRLWKPSLLEPDGDIQWAGPFYFRCQVRSQVYSGVLLGAPKHLDFKPAQITPRQIGQRVQLAGWELMWGTILGVADAGVGFFNEYRQASVFFPSDGTWDSIEGHFTPAASATLQPPEGAVMLGTTPPIEEWANPSWVP